MMNVALFPYSAFYLFLINIAEIIKS